MKEYDGLEPGLYLQQGTQITALKSRSRLGYPISWEEFAHQVDTLRGYTSAETLAAEVAWVYIAISKRRQQILEIPYRWELNGDEVEGITPFGMLSTELLQQTDEGMQLYSSAFWHKQRVGGRVVRVKWLDPCTMEPDIETATAKDGVTRFWRTIGSQRIAMPASDVVWFKIPGQRELMPGTAAGDATALAATILHGLDETDNTLYKNNGLPAMLVRVPSVTPEPERDKVKRAFQRLFNSGGGRSVRVQPVGADVTVEPLSFKPVDMSSGPLEQSKIKAILGAHGVPESIALSGAANLATSLEDRRQFVSTLGSRLKYVAEVLNADPDYQTARWVMVVRVEEHIAMQADEVKRSGAFVNFLQGFEVEAAAFLCGITVDDFPEDMVDIFKKPQPVPAALARAASGDEPTEDDDGGAEDSAEEAAEEKSYRRWLRKRDNPNPADFVAKYLTTEEKELILYEVKSDKAADSAIDELTAVMVKLAGELDSGGKDEEE